MEQQIVKGWVGVGDAGQFPQVADGQGGIMDGGRFITAQGLTVQLVGPQKERQQEQREA